MPAAVSASGSDGAHSSVLKHPSSDLTVKPGLHHSPSLRTRAALWNPGMCSLLFPVATQNCEGRVCLHGSQRDTGCIRHWVYSALRANPLVSSVSKFMFPERGSLSAEATEQEEKVLLGRQERTGQRPRPCFLREGFAKVEPHSLKLETQRFLPV